MLKIALFGAGHLGKYHLNNWKEIEDSKLVGFFDPDDHNAAIVAEKYGIPRFTDASQLMDICDAVDM
jgi:predicted dehydrogenase